MEFHLPTLLPTFRLLWGHPGQSNAFAIAQNKHFEPVVLARARQLALQLAPSEAGERAGELMAPLAAQAEGQRERAEEARRVREEVEAVHAEVGGMRREGLLEILETEVN